MWSILMNDKFSAADWKNSVEKDLTEIKKAIYDIYGFNPESILSKIDCDKTFLWKEVSQYFTQTGDNCKIIKSLYKDYKNFQDL